MSGKRAAAWLFCLSWGGLVEEGSALVLTGGDLVTLDPAKPRAQALVARGGVITFVGSTAEAVRRAPDTERIELEGKTVFPGFTDAHAHMYGLGASLASVDLRGCAGMDDLLARVARKKEGLAEGGWVTGRGWDQNLWPERRFPDHRALSALAPDHPVFLSRVDGHAALANAAALGRAGITSGTPDPPGGKILRFPDGSPTGVLIDNAMELVRDAIPKPERAEVKALLLAAQEHCVRRGLTEVHDAGVTREIWRAYDELGREGKLRLRIYAMAEGTSDFFREALKRGPQTGLHGGHLTLRAVKFYADGALGSRGALLSEPYADDPGNRGLLVTEVERLRSAMKESRSRGFQVATHAIGDGANRIVLDLYEELLTGAPEKELRWRIEHVQVLAPRAADRMKKLGVVASMQPTHCTSDMGWAADRLGKERIRWAYAWRSVLDRGIPLACGSDFPVEEADPLAGIHAAVTRTDAAGNPPAGFHPEQRMTAEEAVRCFTQGGAYAGFEEERKGRIRAGQAADLTVLDRNILRGRPSEILKARVEMTVVAGRVVFRKAR